jgi:hypothetical protein
MSSIDFTPTDWDPLVNDPSIRVSQEADTLQVRINTYSYTI